MNRETILDQFWGMYEIMGVSLVDMQMWQWLYAHPKATAKELKEAYDSLHENNLIEFNKVYIKLTEAKEAYFAPKEN